VYAAALAAVVVVSSFLAAVVAIIFAGLAWMAVTSTLQAELQLILPAWVRARGLAIYTVTFMGSNAAGALLWGLTANQLGLQPAILLATGVMLVGVVAGMIWRVPETDHPDVQPASAGPTRGWPSTPSPRPEPSWSLSTTPSRPNGRRPCWRRCGSCAGFDRGSGARAGSCTATESGRTVSSRCSACHCIRLS
jgi:hypothetical protein